MILNQSFITYIKSELLSDVFLCGTIHVSRVRKEISKSRRDAMPFHQMLEINSIWLISLIKSRKLSFEISFWLKFKM